MKRFPFWSGLFLLVGLVGPGLLAPLSACGPEPGVFHYEYRIHRQENGLPCDRIRALLEVEGVLFAGTEGGGLMVFQNGVWKAYTPQSTPPFPGTTVCALAPGEGEKSVAIGTNVGIVHGSFETGNLEFRHTPMRPDSSPNILALARCGEGWLAGTDREGGVVRGPEFTPVDFGGESDETGIQAAFEGGGERSFFGSSKGLFTLPKGSRIAEKRTGEEFGWVDALHGLPRMLLVGSTHGLFRLLDDKPENLMPGVWVTCMGGNPEVFEPSFQPPENERHEFFVGTEKSGLLLYHSGGRAYRYTMENSRLPSNAISALFAPQSSTGTVWIGTPANGIVQRRYVLPSPALISPTPGQAIFYQDWLYVGTVDQGLIVYDPVSLEIVETVDQNSVAGFHQRVTGIGRDDEGRLWVAGDQGVWMRDRTGWHHFGRADGLPAEAIPLLCIRENRVWAAAPPTASRTLFLSLYNGSEFTPITPEALAPMWTRPPPPPTGQESTATDRGGLPFQMDSALGSAALALLRKSFRPLHPTALLDTPEALLIGDADGSVHAFDGRRFSEWPFPPVKAPVRGLGRLADGQFVILGKEQIAVGVPGSFRLLPPVATDSTAELHCLRVDDFKSSILWVGYSTPEHTGAACYYNGEWEQDRFPLVPSEISAAQPYLFVTGPQGTARVLKLTKPGYFRERDRLILGSEPALPAPATTSGSADEEP